jgi:DNA-binding transcriptional ArsR family regulator
MMKYANNTTIVLWSESAEVRELVERVVTKFFQEVKVYHAERVADLLAVPCFLMILDAQFLTLKTRVLLEEYFKEEESGQPKMVIIGSFKDELSKTLKNRLILGADLYRNLPVRKLIKAEYAKANGKDQRKSEFQLMIKRVIDTIENNQIDRTEIKKSASTLRRDLELIERAEILSKSPEPCKRAERIIAIYLYLKEHFRLSRSFACDRFGISVRTLNRDLEVLRKALGITFYYDDFDECYS